MQLRVLAIMWADFVALVLEYELALLPAADPLSIALPNVHDDTG